MPNDRVQLRPPRRLLAASGDVCSKTQKPLLEKEFDTGACVIDVLRALIGKTFSELTTEGQRTQSGTAATNVTVSRCHLGLRVARHFLQPNRNPLWLRPRRVVVGVS